MISKELIAHSLSIAYVTNLYGPDVRGDFSVDEVDGVVDGGGGVDTERIPDINIESSSCYFHGIRYTSTDELFIKMVADYNKAYTKYLKILNQ